MRYDPDALPFWERERGDGPITRHLRVRTKRRKPAPPSRYRPVAFESSIRSHAGGELGDGCRRVTVSPHP